MSRDYAKKYDKLGRRSRTAASSGKGVWIIASVIVLALLIFGLTKLYKKQFTFTNTSVEQPVVVKEEVVVDQPQFDFFSLLSEDNQVAPIPVPDSAEVVVDSKNLPSNYIYINIIATLNENDAVALQQALRPLSILAGVSEQVKEVVVRKETLHNREWYLVQVAVDKNVKDIEVIKQQLRANGVPTY